MSQISGSDSGFDNFALRARNYLWYAVYVDSSASEKTSRADRGKIVNCQLCVTLMRHFLFADFKKGRLQICHILFGFFVPPGLPIL